MADPLAGIGYLCRSPNRAALRFLFWLFPLFLAACNSEPQAGDVVAVETKRVTGDTVVSAVVQLDYLDLDLPERHYLVLRQELAMADVNGFFGMETEALSTAATKAGVVATGPMTALTYEWDTQKGWADLAVALPVSADTELPPYVNIALAAGPALALNMEGSYQALSAMHVALDRELQRRRLKPRLPAIEEYPVGPLQTNDETAFRTRIIYPYQSPAE